MKRTMLLLAALAALLASSAAAEQTVKGDEDAAAPHAAATVNRGSAARVRRLASEFKVEPSQIEALRAQGLGWGGIRDALAISRKAGVPLSDVMTLRKSGLGWGEIARKYGFPLGQAVGRGRGHFERPPRYHHERREIGEKGERREEREPGMHEPRGGERGGLR
ncbi:MAG: hypothetical protein KGO96_13300 [Elusimicrobia bacterium]|nr:hypothetical protein [Elusimicrobiota bacterium]MDE2237344.1 hypothetical protein [Elusimicrobiota bacterium]MDE2426870.1 hypothetical protein [Elusimicrobiota bacterium]